MTWASNIAVRTIAEVVLGRQRSPQHAEGPFMVKYLRAANVKDGELDLNDVMSMNFTPTEQRIFRLQPGDVLITEGSGSLASVGASAVWNGEQQGAVCFQNTLLRMRPRTGITDGRFLGWWARSAFGSGLFASLAGGANIHHLSAERVRAIRIDLPPLEEQRRIADFLALEMARMSRLEALLRRQKQLLNERESVALPLAVAGARLGEGSISTTVPWIAAMHPRARIVRLIRILQLQRGVDLTDDQRRPGEVAVVTTAGISGVHDTAIEEGPGVVVGRYGSAGSVHWVPGRYWPHNTTLYVRNFKGNHKRYCYHLLRSLPYEMEQARSAIPGINRNDLHRQPVAMLPLELQNKIAAALDEEQATFEVSRKRLRKMETLLAERRQALITAAVTGQIDVTTARGVDVS